ncbi:MAG: hypothetical protein IJ436_04230 [Bacteroidaceae bacterium]|nr:hypothetical protein [Bacteroidaceae bacterium]
MKKILFLLLLLTANVSFAQVQVREYERISVEEIVLCKSYKSVAYNFVYAFINRDIAKVRNFYEWDAYSEFGGDVMMIQGFEKIHDIADMRNVIPLGYYPVVTRCDELNVSNIGSYAGCKAMNVRFDCATPNGEFYDGRYGRFDTNVRVMLVLLNGNWKVIGFK